MIHRIRVQNFKSLRDVTVDLAPVTVFVGKSGTGKSNLVAAIKFLRDFLMMGPQNLHPNDMGELKCLTNVSAPIAFAVEFDVPGFEHRFLYEIVFDEIHLHQNPQMESLKFGSKVLFWQSGLGHNSKWQIEPSLVSVPPPGPPALGRLPGLEEVVVAFTAITSGIGVFIFPNDTLTQSGGFNSAVGFNGINPSNFSNGSFRLLENGQNFLAIMKDISSSLQDPKTRKGIAAALRRVNSTVISVELDSIQAPQRAIVGHRLGNKTLAMNLAQESEGFRRFYAHLLALYQTPPKQTVIFEEPENGIYPGALSLLAEEFKAAPAAGRGQVLLTTHSPALLDQFSAEEIRVVELVDLETKIGPLASEQMEALKEHLLRAGELLTVDPARREAPAQ